MKTNNIQADSGAAQVAGAQSGPSSLHLLYHQLEPEPGAYTYAVTTARFAEHLGFFRRLHATGASPLPQITFDDGHASDFEHALPLLHEFGLRAHFFITAGWTATRRGFMGFNELRALHAAGHRIGAHGWSHALLTRCTPTELQHELRDARLRLEDGLGSPVHTMSFPGGRFNRDVIAACRDAGYTQLYTSIPRADSPAGELIGRLNMRQSTTVEWLQTLFGDGGATLATLGRSYRIKSAAKSVLGDNLYARLWAILNRKKPDSDPAGAMDA